MRRWNSMEQTCSNFSLQPQLLVNILQGFVKTWIWIPLKQPTPIPYPQAILRPRELHHHLRCPGGALTGCPLGHGAVATLSFRARGVPRLPAGAPRGAGAKRRLEGAESAEGWLAGGGVDSRVAWMPWKLGDFGDLIYLVVSWSLKDILKCFFGCVFLSLKLKFSCFGQRVLTHEMHWGGEHAMIFVGITVIWEEKRNFSFWTRCFWLTS